MKTIRGMVKNGQIAISEPVIWPEGTEVRINPIQADQRNGEELPEAERHDGGGAG